MVYDVKVVSINDVDSMVMKDDVQVGQGTDDGNDKETNDLVKLLCLSYIQAN